jgi:hypothetical protein
MKRYIFLALLGVGLLLAIIPSTGRADGPAANKYSTQVTCGSCP